MTATGMMRAARSTAPPRLSACPTTAPTIIAPSSRAIVGIAVMATEPTAKAPSQRLARGGRSAGQERRAEPTRRAGEPAHRSPAGTEEETAAPAAISAPSPT